MTYLYLDIETVPDNSRQDHWNLPELDDLVEPFDLLNGTADKIKNFLKEYAVVLPEGYLDQLEYLEVDQKKRGTVMDAIDTARSANADLVTQMSVDPDMLQIIAIGYAVGDTPPVALALPDFEDSEAEMLKTIWQAMKREQPWIGFNALRFDVRAIVTRSMLLGVMPTCRVDWRRYGNPMMIDLMDALYPFGKWKGLKRVSSLFGIDIPKDDIDGSMIYDLFHRGEWSTIQEYLKSDVELTRQLHKKMLGYFC